MVLIFVPTSILYINAFGHRIVLNLNNVNGINLLFIRERKKRSVFIRKRN